MVRGCLRTVDPCSEHLKNEDVVLRRKLCIDHLAFKIGVALIDKRRADAGGGGRCKAELLKLIDILAGFVRAGNHLLARSTVGMLITHSLVFLSASNE